MRSPNATRILIGVAALGIGLLVYLVDRRPEQTYFLMRLGLTHSLQAGAPQIFGSFGQNLPAFLHVFAFSLLTGGVIGCGVKGSMLVATSWFLINAAFELGQRFPAQAEIFIPQWFDSLPVLESARMYFRVGTFDPFDLIAMAFGAMAAYGFLLMTVERRRS